MVGGEQRGLMEELNLPPALISLVRKNMKIIQAVGIGIVVVVVAWTYYRHYTEEKLQQAASILAVAAKEQDEVRKSELLFKVQTEYSGTNAALWSQLEQGHMEMNGGRFDVAAEKYRAVLQGVKPENPVYPMVLLSLAQAEEALGADTAIERYRQLAGLTGFEALGQAGLGRIYEAQGKWTEARTAYQEYLVATEDNADAALRQVIEEKLAVLQDK